MFRVDGKVYLIYPYYDNPQMLEKQIGNWNRFEGELRKKIEIILVDDCSPNFPALELMRSCKPQKRVYRVLENIPWGQHHARNIGAHEIEDKNAWIFMSDMDIVLKPEEACNLFEINLDENRYHTFERRFFGERRPPKYHLNTFMVKRKHYWAVNGYDVDYCGTYGGDGQFLSQLDAHAKQLHHGHKTEHLKPKVEISGHIVTVWGHEREDVPDANTTEFTRKEGEFREKYESILKKKKASGDLRSKNPIRWKYERVL